MVPEAPLEETGAGLAPVGAGWFVVNAREARWRRRPGRGLSLPLTGFTDEECETHFRGLGMSIVVLGPGEPIGFYHWERDQEDFLVLAGEAILVCEGEERRLRAFDFVHCPPGASHAIVGAGDGPCTLVAVGARAHIDEDCHGGGYVADAVAARHGASVPADTTDASADYARLGEPEAVRYRDGLLPELRSDRRR
jgi:uncharacterized cupin superfamily protein